MKKSQQRTQKKQLRLDAETLRQLDTKDIAVVAGGDKTTTVKTFVAGDTC